jgi:two-component system response regulator DevR
MRRSALRKKPETESSPVPAYQPDGDEKGTEAVAPLQVMLIDPLHTVRAGLEMLIAAESNMDVVAQASSAGEALEDLKSLKRSTNLLIVLGLNLAGEHDSFWLIRKVRETFPTISIVAVGANADKGVISRAFFMGADGFIDKNAAPADFIGALGRAAAGEVVIVGPPLSWIGPITEEVGRQRDAGPVLTSREQEVICVAAEGLTARDIGVRLGLSERTITTHLHRIYSKLGVGSRLAAIQAANRQGLVAVVADFN